MRFVAVIEMATVLYTLHPAPYTPHPTPYTLRLTFERKGSNLKRVRDFDLKAKDSWP